MTLEDKFKIDEGVERVNLSRELRKAEAGDTRAGTNNIKEEKRMNHNKLQNTSSQIFVERRESSVERKMSPRLSTLDAGPRRRRFRFENLEVWQQARALNQRVYRLTRKFPSEEQFGLTSQIRRAAVSVSSNISEGSGRNSDKDFAHFLEQAYGSLMEVASQIFLAMDERYLTEGDAESVFEAIDKLAGKMVALNRSLDVANSKIRLK